MWLLVPMWRPMAAANISVTRATYEYSNPMQLQQPFSVPIIMLLIIITFAVASDFADCCSCSRIFLLLWILRHRRDSIICSFIRALETVQALRSHRHHHDSHHLPRPLRLPGPRCRQHLHCYLWYGKCHRSLVDCWWRGASFNIDTCCLHSSPLRPMHNYIRTYIHTHLHNIPLVLVCVVGLAFVCKLTRCAKCVAHLKGKQWTTQPYKNSHTRTDDSLYVYVCHSWNQGSITVRIRKSFALNDGLRLSVSPYLVGHFLHSYTYKRTCIHTCTHKYSSIQTSLINAIVAFIFTLFYYCSILCECASAGLCMCMCMCAHMYLLIHYRFVKRKKFDM